MTPTLKKKIFTLFLMMSLPPLACFASPLSIRGVVYDVGLMFGGTSLSLEKFDTAQVAYDMSVISHVMCCNAIRIEGEDIGRLKKAAELAHAEGLKVYFNPWKHEANEEETNSYLHEASIVAEELRLKGVDITFVTACEYTLFSRGAFPGNSFNERMGWFISLGGDGSAEAIAKGRQELEKKSQVLNKILRRFTNTIRKNFNGPVTYSAGAWESVDWSLFDVVGVDYYRNGESEADYVAGLSRYQSEGKPIIVMEMGCCAYEGAAPRGGFGFSILQGTDENGVATWDGGVEPRRSEQEQADYIVTNIGLLEQAKADGIFVYVFRYPIYPHRSAGLDMDKVSYSLVKSYPKEDARYNAVPSWEPKEAFFRLGQTYSKLAE